MQELEKTLEIESAKQLGPLPTVGWAATAADAAAAIAAGATLLHLPADPAAQEVVGTAAAGLPDERRSVPPNLEVNWPPQSRSGRRPDSLFRGLRRAALRVLCTLDPAAAGSEAEAVAACSAAAARLGQPAVDVLLLPEACWAYAAAVLAAGGCTAVGLAVSTAAGAALRPPPAAACYLPCCLLQC